METIEKFGVRKTDLLNFVSKILEEDELKDIDITIKGIDTQKGCTGLAIFIDATGKTINNKSINYNFVVKHSSVDKYQRSEMLVGTFYQVEKAFYSKILPCFQTYLNYNNLEQLHHFPKYFKTVFMEDREMLALENLCVKGFKLHDIKKPMNIKHIKLVLENYAKLHSLSFAIRQHSLEVWEDAIKGFYGLKICITQGPGAKIFLNFHESLCDILKSSNEEELLNKVKSYDFVDMFRSQVFNDEWSVVVHGDCWNNNYLFKYKDNDAENPEAVSFIDWQLSSLGYLEIDLSKFLFTSISTEHLNELDNLLDYYYTTFSNHLKEYQLNPHTVYPKTVFLQKWKKYCKFGITDVPYIYEQAAEDESKKIDFREMIENDDCQYHDMFSCNVKNKNVSERVVNLIKYLDGKGYL
ncbi:unnamed protein product [Brassicogethes aeneus]|uniref:CHK kinase-like domain-containing protein n=1 Tax=Brassicogethes aeneus TaxID=1431903 RepID=A0A9P0FDX0_BRAAE|nr:unnamed protein product [Brassicogethes aeneus]